MSYLNIQKSIFNSGFLYKNAIFFIDRIDPWFSVFYCTFQSILVYILFHVSGYKFEATEFDMFIH